MTILYDWEESGGSYIKIKSWFSKKLLKVEQQVFSSVYIFNLRTIALKNLKCCVEYWQLLESKNEIMIYREAKVEDIRQIQRVRNSVKENMLSDPALVSDADCEDFMCRRGKGWVCEDVGVVVGFAIADLLEDNIWALFVDPDFEKRGIGKRLQVLMLDWYFDQDKEMVWLGTAPGTRAEQFYRKSGWRETGTNGSKELKFEMRKEEWRRLF